MNQNEIKNMFGEIADGYDRLNDVISFGIHRKIKRAVVKSLNLSENDKGLDLCTGSGDFVKIIGEIYPGCEVTGVDNCEKMLEKAKLKNPSKNFVTADCTSLPFNSSEFDFVTAGFGLRNIIERSDAVSEIFRVLKPGGIFLHLDFGKHNAAGKFFDVYTPFLAGIFGGNKENYKYLINSKNNYPEPNELIKEFESYGFELVNRKDYLFGAISAQIMKKPG